MVHILYRPVICYTGAFVTANHADFCPVNPSIKVFKRICDMSPNLTNSRAKWSMVMHVNL